MPTKAKRPRRDIYQEVTDRIVGYLAKGVAPWRNPIKRGSGDRWPKNLSNGKRYRGINVILLAMRAWENGYASDYWLTFKQAKRIGGMVRKGEEESLVTFWKLYEREDGPRGEKTTLPILKHYTAFNVEQIAGISIPDAPNPNELEIPFTPLGNAQQIVDGFIGKPKIEYGGTQACYRPVSDVIRIPAPRRFDSSETFYATLFHELSHSTGHRKRLDRGLNANPPPFGSPDYSREELVAELSAAFLSAVGGISPATIQQSASYLQNWIDVLKGDKRLVVSAAGAAQKSADLILGNLFQDAVLDKRTKPLLQQTVPSSSVEGVPKGSVLGNRRNLF